MDSCGQHTLRWDRALNGQGVSIEPGSLNLYTYPATFTGAALDLIRRIVLDLAMHATHLFEVPDPVGAFVLHALVVCNTKESLKLAMAIFESKPQLLLQTHAGQPFLGENNLHIVCANRQEELACALVELCVARCTPQEAIHFLSSQAVGVFFEAEPMCWYGESPLGYACAFGLRKLVRRMLNTGLVTLDSNPGAILGFCAPRSRLILAASPVLSPCTHLQAAN